MNDEEYRGERGQPDRRQRPTRPLDALRCCGRRKAPRRSQDRAGNYYVDRFSATTLVMIVGLLVLTIVDGVLTVELLDSSRGEEINPFMAYLLGRGRHAFFAGKYLLTAAGLPFLLVFKNYRLFGTRLRVGFLFPAFIGLYLALLFYQWSMFK
jgi:hypothetical protein